MSRRDDPVYQLKHLVYNVRFQPDVRRWQRSATGMLEPIMRKVERPDGTYGLLPEKSMDGAEIKRVIAEFTGRNCFSALAVNPTTSGGRPDWASAKAIAPHFHSLIYGQDGGELQEAMADWRKEMTLRETKEYKEIRRLLRTEIRQLARNLSNDVGAFPWLGKSNGRKDGPLMVCQLSLFPVMVFFATAVMMNDREWTRKAMAVLNILRFHMIVGAKRVQQSAWYVMTA